ncbi:hypothetical protein JCM8547_003552 [Rhodosporidiobolus lusitaniae]
MLIPALPNELVVLILDDLFFDLELEMKVALSLARPLELVCKTWYSLVQPFKWYNIDLDCAGDSSSNALAAHILEHEDKIIPHVRSLLLSYEDATTSSVSQQAANVLLKKCTKVEELFVDCHPGEGDGLFASELTQTLVSAPFSLWLLYLDVLSCNWTGPTILSSLSIAARLPLLERLVVDVGEDDGRGDDEDLPADLELLVGPTTSCLSDLRIDSSPGGNFELAVPPELLEWVMTKPLVNLTLDTRPMGRQFLQPHLPKLPLTLTTFTLNSWMLPPLPSLHSFLSALPATLSAEIHPDEAPLRLPPSFLPRHPRPRRAQ